MSLKPKLRATLALAVVGVLLAMLVRLGLWQLDRASEKLEIRDRYEARVAAPPVDLATTLLGADDVFRRGRATGVYEADKQLLIDNAVLDGRAGYRVVTPLRVGGDGVRLLVDRGWIPGSGDRRQLPPAPVPVGEVTVSGLLTLPAEHYFSLEQSPPAAGQRVWQNLDLARYRELHPGALAPLVLQLAPGVAGVGGFERRPVVYSDQWIARHRGYAVTWFGLAAVLLAGTVIVAVRGRRDAASTDGGGQ